MARTAPSDSPPLAPPVTLHMALLGVPATSWAGNPLPLLRRQTRALLYRLACDLQPVTRAQLCFLFWPDMAEGTARKNLTRLLVLLRTALPEPALLVTRDETIALDGERVGCDTTAFLNLTARALPATRRQALAQAVELVRGPFLDGFSLPDAPEYETWLDEQRRMWERRTFNALAALIEAHTSAHDYAAAIAAAQRYLQTDELAEEIHRRLIALHALAGDRTEALRQYERCAVILERELGVSPLPETRATYEAVREGEMPLPERTSGDFPPLLPAAPPRPTEAPPSAASIPTPLTPLVGRTQQTAEVAALLQHADVRLLTLNGPGGAGKTRLAIEAARRAATAFADGAAWVPLAPLRDATRVIPVILERLGLPDRQEDRPLLRLQEALRGREMLLVLDNCEHVVAAVAEIAALLETAPRLTVLATSRSLLRMAGEQSYFVPPLALPDPAHLPALDALAQVESMALFLARVQARLPAFRLTEANAPIIASICARLDGLPLAIELAAARAALLSPRMLLARLDRRLALLIDGPRDLPERQRTLRATIDWSYHLLDLSEQLLFGRLAVFAGGGSPEAAEAVSEAVGPLAKTPVDGLHALLDKHLILRMEDAAGEARVTLLETIREYALERLAERGEATAAQRAHAEYYLALSETAAAALHGPAQIAWFNRLDLEHANLRVALEHFVATGDAPGALRMAGALHWFWFARGHLTEGRTWIEQALALAEGSPLGDDPERRRQIARAHCTAGQLAAFQGRLAAARSHLDTAIALCRSMDDRATLRLLHNALMFLVVTAVWQGDFPAADKAVGEYNAIVQALDEPWTNAMWAFNTGRMELHQRYNVAAAQRHLQRAETLFRQAGDIGFLTQVLTDLGTIALEMGDVDAARQSLSEALTSARAMRDRVGEANVLNNLGEAARLVGDDATAAQLYAASLRIHRELDAGNEIPRILHNLGYLALHAGDLERARLNFIESLEGYRAIGQSRGMVEPIAGLASLLAAGETPADAERAARLWGAADAIYAAERAPVWPADRAEHLRYKAIARATVGDSVFDAAYAEGSTLTVEQVVTHALRV